MLMVLLPATTVICSVSGCRHAPTPRGGALVFLFVLFVHSILGPVELAIHGIKLVEGNLLVEGCRTVIVNIFALWIHRIKHSKCLDLIILDSIRNSIFQALSPDNCLRWTPKTGPLGMLN